jgi:transposase
LDSHPIGFSLLALLLCVHASKLYRWYKHCLSDFTGQVSSGELHAHDLKKGAETLVRVPILAPEHIGEQMAIDEKHIDGDYHTILSNRQTGKIALMARTVRAGQIQQILAPYWRRRFTVEGLTRDLSNTYEWVGRECFPRAVQIADKFHILRDALQALQDHRNSFRQELLFKFEHQWSHSQSQRARVLFRHYSSLEKAYKLVCGFRSWYDMKWVGTSSEGSLQRLQSWQEQVEEADIYELMNFKSLVERHQGFILIYFKDGHTNARAENINRTINSLIRANQGTRDKEFFYFRLKNYFT